MITKDSIDSLESITEELTLRTHQTAIDQGLITQADEDWLNQHGITGYQINQPGNEKKLADAAIGMAARTQTKDTEEQQSNLRLAELMGADRLVLNALNNAYRAAVTPSPYEHFTNFFEDGLKNPDERGDFIKALQGAKNDMVISIVQTMHPTIYHTAFAREMETKLTEKLEELVKDFNNQEPGNRALNQDLLREARDTIGELVRGIHDGKTLTPTQRVTVAEENELDHHDHIKMKENFELVGQQYNKALREVADRLQEEGTLDAQQCFDLMASKIDVDKRIQYRTWAYAADSDGRDKATSLELYRGIYSQVEADKTYKSRIRDPRANAKDQKDAVSCLIQKAFRLDYKEFPDDTAHGQFRQFCTDFVEECNARHTGEREGWNSPEKSILQQLTNDEQAEFLRRLVADEHTQDGVSHFVPPFIKPGTIAFCTMFRDEYPKFLEDSIALQKRLYGNRYEEWAQLHPGQVITRDTELESLSHISLRAEGEPTDFLLRLKKHIDRKKVTVNDEEVAFTLDPDSLTYERSEPYEGTRLFGKCKKWDGDSKRQIPLSREDNRKLLDIIKRLQVLDYAIDDLDGTVADRYQIANFEGAADFYSTMLLFKEAGLITVQGGKVVEKPKLSIQPLLESAKDQEDAPEMFRKLLEDPLVRSYYQQLGKADVMFGYSDGSKSAGNFASEWSIRENARKVQEVFKEAGIELHVFHGRGRGDSRGGQFAEGQSQRMMDPELAIGMRNDITMQSDLPMHMAISKSYGQDTCASILSGTIIAKLEAEQERRKMQDPEYRSHAEHMEQLIGGIAKTSENTYQNLIARRPETTILLDAVHDNPLKSSRAPKRPDNGGSREEKTLAQKLQEALAITPEKAEEKLDKTRAITMEYGLEMVDAPLNYIGMRTALQEFIDSKTRPDGKKDPQEGLEALQLLYETNPFFHGMLDKTVQGLNNYDPAVFMLYAKFAGVEDWAKECVVELSGDPKKGKLGLRDLVQDIRGTELSYTTDMPAETRRAAALSKVTRIFRHTGEATDTAQPQEPQADKIKGIIDRGANNPREASYRVRELDLLGERSTDLDKTTHALALSLAAQGNRIKPAAELGYNPFKPNRDNDPHPLRTRFVDIMSFIAQAIHPENLLYPSASTLIGVDHFHGI